MSERVEIARLRRLERMLEISRELNSTIALGPLLSRIVETAAELTESEGASILLHDDRTGELRFCTATGKRSDQLANIPVPIEGSIAGAVLTSRRPLVVSDAKSDARHFDGVEQKTGVAARSLLAVPLLVRDQAIGVLETLNKRGGVFNQEDVDTLMTLAAQAAVAIENARLVGALRKAYDRLGELDKLKSDFISIASHELRTPLSLILLYADLLQDEVAEEAGAQLDAVLRAATRLKHIIETMLNLRYLETGEMHLSPSLFDLRDEVKAACADYQPLAETGGLTLRADLPVEAVTIHADQEKVRVVLDNLISNAVKFTLPGGQVRVTLARPGGDADSPVEINVTDSGVGIPPEHLAHIFDRFYQVEDHMTRRQGGMGLGLSIVKGLVELHGGRVGVESVPGRGSRFTVTLPARAPAESAPRRPFAA